MRKYLRIISISILVMLAAAGCGRNAAKEESEVPVIEDFEALLYDQQTQVIVRDETNATEGDTTEEETMAVTEEEIEMVEPYADRAADGNDITYNIETTVYENGTVRVEYPCLAGMADAAMQQEINEQIRRAVVDTIQDENLSAYELVYETATKGSGIVSFIFRGTARYTGSAYPDRIVKTLNIDLDTGKNVRLKNFSDMAYVVTCLEQADGYTIINEGVDMADFSAFLNNGAMTDYAITLLDYDVDFDNLDMVPAGFSAIRNNHLILFIRAEHAMGDYVELEFGKNL